MAFTVVPLHNISLPPETRIPFGDELVFQDTPKWVKDDESFLNYLSYNDKQSVLSSKHAFVAEYEAAAIGEPDPKHPAKDGQPQRTIQESKAHLALLGNLAIWLRQPSSLCFTVSLHACMWPIHGHKEKRPILQHSERSDPLHSPTYETAKPLYCHPTDVNNPLTAKHITSAAQDLYPVLVSLHQESAVWVAHRAIWAGLTSYAADIRYLWFWIALEALFGPDDSTELSHKLAERIAFFIAEKSSDARDLFYKSKKCYSVRSKIVHGRSKNFPDIDQLMHDTEAIVRTAFRRVIENPDVLAIFISKKRDEYLADLVFSRIQQLPERR